MELLALSLALLDSSQSTLGTPGRQRQDLFDDSATDTCYLIHDNMDDALLRNPASSTLHECFSPICVTIESKLCWMENKWWVWKAGQLLSYADVNDTNSFYEALTDVYGLTNFSFHPVRSIDGALFKDNGMILARWTMYQQSMLNKLCATDLGFLLDLPTVHIFQN